MNDAGKRCSPGTDMLLLPCPFCGNPPHSHADDIKYNADDMPYAGQWIIECNACPVDSNTWGATKDIAIQQWNTRGVAQASAEPVAWRCFHCGEVFTDEDLAREHFGPDTEWQPGCIDPLTKDEKERRRDQVAMFQELDREREENSRLMNRDYVLSCFERDLAKMFDGAKSVTQAYLVFDSMEGRALSAEEQIATLAKSPPAISGDAVREALCKNLGVMELRFDMLARGYRGYLPDTKTSDTLTRIALIDDVTASFRGAADEIAALASPLERVAADGWTPDQFWEYAEGMLGSEWLRDQMRDMMSERGLRLTSSIPSTEGKCTCGYLHGHADDCPAHSSAQGEGGK